MTVLLTTETTRRDRAHADYPARRAARPLRIAPSPVTRRPRTAGLRYPNTAVRVSRAPHRRRRAVSPAATVGLAVLAGLITVWLGLVAQFGAAANLPETAAAASETLAVVQVKPGESLNQLAARVAPATPSDQVVARIRDLNKLDGVDVRAGQTLIAPIA
ncbi:LysM peptidoglycan-binding domain-containing protein [Mycolicibacterium brumae]|uniref:LysM peptidoglycan-binding domain-containing protein n=1 Tax=Mycolicibacterium brumae TaxID=85968 RepID=A0A2G5PDB8_9MYCO|nr:LysM peptidoglycan-binding domain-containing protein [Mycolicibacterium brumae]MCV7193494.1 LysM peptidoglycan-binding domain-containing protein [Mycolicibacterium brumae]PIB76080.1 LysM peptidoglycan-binding domain-containing protein [Mycolicibacterium brumae]RWA17192.1 hypothetical protein MBRU_06095 [Mycolicibacterium brumae DSM 44177]UWW09233.1 LysM peptidoglycan-binding domain-containing protein [Mycolicibacterium brumae]